MSDDDERPAWWAELSEAEKQDGERLKLIRDESATAYRLWLRRAQQRCWRKMKRREGR